MFFTHTYARTATFIRAGPCAINKEVNFSLFNRQTCQQVDLPVHPAVKQSVTIRISVWFGSRDSRRQRFREIVIPINRKPNRTLPLCTLGSKTTLFKAQQHTRKMSWTLSSTSCTNWPNRTHLRRTETGFGTRGMQHDGCFAFTCTYNVNRHTHGMVPHDRWGHEKSEKKSSHR